MQPTSAYEGSDCDRKKISYSDMLKGYESPKGGTVQVAIELATLMIVSVAAESTNRVKIMAQNDIHERMIKQAEQQRELLEKEFTQSSASIKAEHEKTISEATKVRNYFAQLCQLANNNVEDKLQKIDDKQGTCLVKFQLDFMKKKANRFEKELQEAAERHEQELQRERALNDNKDQDLRKGRLKIRKFQKEIKDFENNLMGVSAIKDLTMKHKSAQEKVDGPKAKRIKIDDTGKIELQARKNRKKKTKERSNCNQGK
jgi:hypothetical protein